MSFSVGQAVEIAAAQQRGLERCRANGGKPGKVFSVIMVGRLDDYLRDVAHDMSSDVPESDLIQAGTAAIKKAYKICKERGYESKLMPAGMRGGYHAEALAGADMSMSLSSGIQSALAKQSLLTEKIDESVAPETLLRLLTIPEFVRAYELAALPVSDFIRFGVSQRTLSQFVDAGWEPIGEFVL